MTTQKMKAAAEDAAFLESGVPVDDGLCYAALDLGTNSCRMLIARAEGNGFRIIDAFSKTVLLGQGLDTSGALSRSAIRRTIAALHTCQHKLEKHDVHRARLVATAACRQAKNGAPFLSRVEAETGLALEMISPREEAQLAVIGCAPLVERNAEQLLVVDIGGGSTELVWIDMAQCPPEDRIEALMRLNWRNGTSKNIEVVDWISVPLGVSTLDQQYSDVSDDKARFALMSCAFEDELEAFAEKGPGRGAHFQVISTSGTMTTLAATHLGLRKYSRDAVDGLSMTTADVNQVVEGYLRLGRGGRAEAPCVGSARSDLIMSGCAIVQAILRRWPTENLTVADRGLREGLLYSEMAKDRFDA